MTQKNRTAKKRPTKTHTKPWITAIAIGAVGITGVAAINANHPAATTEAITASPAAAHPTTTAKAKKPVVKATAGQKAAQAAYDAGFRGNDLVTMIAIADQESDFRSVDNAGLNRDGSVDYGVWQINKRTHASLFRKYNWKDVRDNARMAKACFDERGPNGKRRGFTPWASYNSGAYRSNLANARTLAAGVSK